MGLGALAHRLRLRAFSATAPMKPRRASSRTIKSAAASAASGAVSTWISALLGRLVGRIDAGEVLELAAPGLLVQALGIALLGDRERRVDEDLDELARRPAARAPSALGAEGRDEGGDDDEAGVDHQLGHLGDAADVLDPVGVGEARDPC